MKVYFAGSIRGGRDDARLYMQIIDHLGNFGDVLTEHVGKKDLDQMGENELNDRQIHDRDMSWLNECDQIVAEVTTVSLGVGYEIGRAVEVGKSVLCLYRPERGKRLSAMIAGSHGVTLVEYENVDDVKRILDWYFADQKRINSELN